MAYTSSTVTRTKKKQINSLPNEIVFEILVRIPICNLLKTLQFVCKGWFSIIHSRSFSYQHLERTKQLPSSDLNLAIVSTTDGHSFSLSSIQHHCDQILYRAKSTTPISTSSPHTGVFVKRGNSINGLLCFASNDCRIHICNPATGELISTPENPMYNSRSGHMTQGMCFCPLSMEYKVVIAHCENTCYFSTQEVVCPVIAEVLTLGRDQSWRKLVWTRPWLKLSEECVCVGGSLFWCTSASAIQFPGPSKKNTTIIRFDFVREEFDAIVVPVITHEWSVSVAELEGRLCLIHLAPDGFVGMEIWMAMDITNLSDSFVRTHRISIRETPSFEDVESSFVVGISGEKLVMHGLEDDVLAYVATSSGDILGVIFPKNKFTVIPYLQSLISLGGFTITHKFQSPPYP